jgi:hypothetical protein
MNWTENGLAIKPRESRWIGKDYLIDVNLVTTDTIQWIVAEEENEADGWIIGMYKGVLVKLIVRKNSKLYLKLKAINFKDIE